jgi:hypothetical protein
LLKSAIDQKWHELQASRPKPLIFWGFIEPERNRLLKNYEHGISRSLVSRRANGEVIKLLDSGNAQGGIYGKGIDTESFIASGPFANRPEIEVALEAWAWWGQYLDKIDAIVTHKSAA